MRFADYLGNRIAHFTGRHKPVHGGLAATVQAADPSKCATLPPLLEAGLRFIGNQLSVWLPAAETNRKRLLLLLWGRGAIMGLPAVVIVSALNYNLSFF